MMLGGPLVILGIFIRTMYPYQKGTARETAWSFSDSIPIETIRAERQAFSTVPDGSDTGHGRMVFLGVEVARCRYHNVRQRD